MKNVRAGWVVIGGLWLAACGEAVAPESLSQVSTSTEELVSESEVSEAVDLTDRADFRTDVANTDRVCDISDATIRASENLLGWADQLDAHLQANHAGTVSAERSPAFARANEVLLGTLTAPNSCRTIVGEYIAMVRTGRRLGQALFREHLPRQDDRLGVIVKETRIAFGRLYRALRADLGQQVTDRRVSDAAGTRP